MVFDIDIPQNTMNPTSGAQTNAVSPALDNKTAATRHKAAPLVQMSRENRLVFDVGVLRNTMGLAPEIRATIVSTVLNDKNAMLQISLVKLNYVVCNIEIAGDFGLWITKHGTTEIQIPIPVQQYYDMTLDDLFSSFSMQSFNVGTMIQDHLKNLIEDYVDNSRAICTCTNLERLLLLIYELEITYMPFDIDDNVVNTATPLILD